MRVHFCTWIRIISEESWYFVFKCSTSTIHFLVYGVRKETKRQDNVVPLCRSFREHVVDTERFCGIRFSLRAVPGPAQLLF